MSYQVERDEFISRVSQAGLPIGTTRALLRAATTMQRYAELACSSEAANKDRVPCPSLKTGKGIDCCCDQHDSATATVPRITVQNHRLEARITHAMPQGWAIDTQGDPRGYVLRVIPPSYAERNAGRDRGNLEAIGVPARESRLRF